MSSLAQHHHAPHVTLHRGSIIAVMFLLGGGIFWSTYDGVRESGDLARLDAPMLEWVTTHRSPGLTTSMLTITNLFSPLALSVGALLIASIWAWRKKEVWRPVLLVGAMSAAFIVSSLIKHITQRARPPLLTMVPPLETDYSFPSGHTIGVAVFLLVLGYLFYLRRPTSWRLATWGAVTFTGITIVAFSRLYLGYHWITDVSASLGLALIILAIVIIVDMLVWGRRDST